MSRFTGRFSRRRDGGRTPSPAEREPAETAGRAMPPVLVEDHDGLLLVRRTDDDSLHPADIVDLSRTLRPHDGTVTVVVGSEGDTPGSLWPRLGELLDSLREEGTDSVRLVMAGTGRDGADRPATARRLADERGLEVEAPDGPVLVVPGGSVFVPPGDGGWWRFAPGQPSVLLGPRTPAPAWQPALREVRTDAVHGCVVHQIPAGLLIRPVDATAPEVGDLFHAVPVDPRRPAVIVGVPWGEDVSADDVVRLLEALPAELRGRIRLAPGGRRDLLPLARSLASALDVDIEVTTGLPLFAAEGPLGEHGVRSVLVGPDGTPRWVPFVDAVLCAPTRDAERLVPPRLLRWFPPLRDFHDARDGVVALSEEWRAAVTRAGLWVGPNDDGPVPLGARAVSSEGPVIEVGRPGGRLTPSLWPLLTRLVTDLSPDLKSRASLQVLAATPDGGRALRALAAEQRLRVIRFASAPVRAPMRTRPEPTVSVPAPVPAPVPTLAEPMATLSEPVPVPVPEAVTRSATATTPPDEGSTPSVATSPVPAATAPDPVQVPEPDLERERDPEPDLRSVPRPDLEPDPVPDLEPVLDPAPAPAPAPVPIPDPTAIPVPDPTPIPEPLTPLPARAEASRSDASRPQASRRPSARAARPAPPAIGESGVRMLPSVPVSPRHRSTPAERASFRELAETVWGRHAAAVNRVLAGMPALRGGEQEAARADLIAVRMYVQGGGGEDGLGHEELARSLQAGEGRLVPYAACLASGLARLPSYRGLVVRGAGGTLVGAGLSPGQLLRDVAPLSGLPLDPGGREPVPGVAYAIWSITGRRVRELQAEGEEIVFPPGTAFRVLDVRDGDSGPLVLLRQLPDADTAATVLGDADETALTRLDHSLTPRLAPGEGTWPDRCAGPLVQD